jgi:hypothetical protein
MGPDQEPSHSLDFLGSGNLTAESVIETRDREACYSQIANAMPVPVPAGER